MAYCSNCGNQLVEGARFCTKCGTPVDSGNNNQQGTSYEEEIQECPNCGEALSASAVSCPTCGYELRDTTTVSSVQELVHKLEQIDKEDSSKNKNLFSRISSRSEDEKKEKVDRKIDLIKNYPMNTKKDIFDFAVVAASNVDMDSIKEDGDAYRRKMSEAWFAKLEQAYRKAKVELAGDSRFNEIQTLYVETHKNVKKAKAAHRKSETIAFIILVILLVVLLVIQKKQEAFFAPILTKIWATLVP